MADKPFKPSKFMGELYSLYGDKQPKSAFASMADYKFRNNCIRVNKAMFVEHKHNSIINLLNELDDLTVKNEVTLPKNVENDIKDVAKRLKENNIVLEEVESNYTPVPPEIGIKEALSTEPKIKQEATWW